MGRFLRGPTYFQAIQQTHAKEFLQKLPTGEKEMCFVLYNVQFALSLR
jgi:hypothetical protein